ncbi:MAG: LysE family transporter [Endomicrobium sp.]|jgi:threonine/homoserine/homoserine lactone efflux protein|uniref:LysE family transporter n=1 Tax=Candidatus Endomicrobiellum cubanum TaxID=3242325 RepID=UPI002829D20E|nr:LysE family transporter [Endomicrobium sp.]
MGLSTKNTNQLFKSGLKIGLLLQVGGIGPICMLMFRLSLFLPISKLLLGVIGITLADIVYVCLSVLSISALVKKIQHYERVFDIVVGTALIIFGILFITAGHVIDANTFKGQDLFIWLCGLTLANPITILFITGIFSLELSKRNMQLKETIVFAGGFLLATPISMTFVVLIGSLTGRVLPEFIVPLINSFMGCILVFLGAKNIFFKKQKLGVIKNATGRIKNFIRKK